MASGRDLVETFMRTRPELADWKIEGIGLVYVPGILPIGQISGEHITVRASGRYFVEPVPRVPRNRFRRARIRAPVHCLIID